MSGGHRFNKKFNSLDKRGLGGPVHPVNHLRSGNGKPGSVSPPSGSRLSVRNQLKDVFGDLVDNSRNLRKSLESKLHDPVVESDDCDTGGKDEENMIRIKTLSGKDVFTFNGDIDENLGEMLVVRSMLINGESIQQARPGELTFRISINDDFLLFTQKQRIITAISRNLEFKSIHFSINKRAILIELNNSGYIYLKYIEDDSNILSYFLKNKQWNVNTPTRVVNDLLLEKIRIIKQKRTEHLNKSSLSKNTQETANHLPVVSPDVMYGRTRSSNRISGYSSPITNGNSSTTKSRSIYDEDLVKPNMVPHLFEVELKYVFSDNKVFTITYSDFKTLYDNDWINDSLIDFFIKYEMDKAIYQKHLFKQTDIYAFNSFFFTKLMSGDEFNDEIDYYGNIKRWLNKLDLMSYPNIIIPINENLHWYCCVIKGLPQLLESALKRKEALASSNGYEDIQEAECDDSADIGDSESTVTSTVLTSEASTKVKKIYQPEIFIFDSLRQKHTNIHFPLKKFIIDYCREKYDVDIGRNEIRVHSAKVPKQNNFNDCGIHVIYNVRKWLNNSDECERIWRSSNLRTASRLLFIAEERNGMRRELRNVLLNLKKKQKSEQNDASNDRNSHHADDDIEVLEYTPVISNRSTKLPKLDEEELSNKLEKPSRNATPEQNEVQETRTLDPKARDTSIHDNRTDVPDIASRDSTAKRQQQQTWVENDMLRDSLSGAHLSITLKEVLNDYFLKYEKISDLQLRRVLQLRDEINELDDLKDYTLIKKFITTFIKESNDIRNNEYDRAMRPKDEDLVIMHCSDNEELNQSVNGLSLSNVSDGSKHNETPSSKSRRGSITVIQRNKVPTDSNELVKRNRDSIEISSPSQVNMETKILNHNPHRNEDIALYKGSSKSPNDEEKLSKVQGTRTPNPDLGLGSPSTPMSEPILIDNSSTLKRRKLDKEKHK